MSGLISILAMYRAPAFALRLAISALASLVASCGAAGCEAVLEWNNPEANDEMGDDATGAEAADEEAAHEQGHEVGIGQWNCAPAFSPALPAFMDGDDLSKPIRNGL